MSQKSLRGIFCVIIANVSFAKIINCKCPKTHLGIFLAAIQDHWRPRIQIGHQAT